MANICKKKNAKILAKSANNIRNKIILLTRRRVY
jgi:hypothetical protein